METINPDPFAWSRIAFFAIITLLAAQRLLEVRYSKQNELRILSTGGYEASPGHFRVMQILHTLWFPAMIMEVLLLSRSFQPWLAACAFLGLLAGQALRYTAILGLGERWTVKIMIQPDAPAKQTGIYNYIRHPNYLGVVLEFLAVPLLHSAWLVALVFSAANGLLLFVRIRAEERALRETSASDYDAKFAPLGRFVP